MKARISAIVAVDSKNGMGKEGKIPWKVPGEQKRFREITTPHPIIMGRKTFESIGRILPDRLNIIVSRHPFNFVPGENDEEKIITTSLEEAISIAKENDSEEIFIIGGGQIFKEAMEGRLIDRIYLTIVEGDFNCDTFFPDYSEFKKVILEEKGESEGQKFTYKILER